MAVQSIYRIAKMPVETCRYKAEFSDRLMTGETLSTFVVTCSDGITVDEDALGTGVTSGTFLVGGGEAAHSYTVTVTVTTTGGQTLVETADVVIKERISDVQRVYTEAGATPSSGVAVFTGIATALRTATTNVDLTLSTVPEAGFALVATSESEAEWQSPDESLTVGLLRTTGYLSEFNDDTKRAAARTNLALQNIDGGTFQ